jgi:hypothetical protein
MIYYANVIEMMITKGNEEKSIDLLNAQIDDASMLLYVCKCHFTFYTDRKQQK